MGGLWNDKPERCDRWFWDKKEKIVFAQNWDCSQVYHCICGWKEYGREWLCTNSYSLTKGIRGMAVQCPHCKNFYSWKTIKENTKRGLTKPSKSGRLRK